MFKQLIARLFGGPAAANKSATAVDADAADTAPPAVGARRPLVSAKGEVAGYEFHVGRQALLRAGQSGASVAVAAHATALLTALRIGTQAGRVGFAELPASALDGPAAEVALPSGSLLCLQFSPLMKDFAPIASGLRRWRDGGSRMGWRVDAAKNVPTSERADFLVMSQGTTPLAEFQTKLQAAKQRYAGIPLVALELESISALESCLQNGADFASCAMSTRSDQEPAGQIAPQAQRVLQLLNSIVQDAKTEELVASIKADVGLSYRLLRYLNSASIGAAKEIGSIQQAVVLLGRDDLYRWLSVLLVRVSGGRAVSSALQEVALARSRFLELLAEARGEAKPGDFFTLGMTSMLGELLSTPMAKVVESLQLPVAAKQALLERTGPWAEYLELAQAVEHPDSPAFVALAEKFGGADVVQALSHAAWGFAADPDHA